MLSRARVCVCTPLRAFFTSRRAPTTSGGRCWTRWLSTGRGPAGRQTSILPPTPNQHGICPPPLLFRRMFIFISHHPCLAVYNGCTFPTLWSRRCGTPNGFRPTYTERAGGCRDSQHETHGGSRARVHAREDGQLRVVDRRVHPRQSRVSAEPTHLQD